MIQNINISVEVPAGYEATGEYREPRDGENYVSIHGAHLATAGHDFGPGSNRMILRKVWAFPSWFAAGWWVCKCNFTGHSSPQWYVSKTAGHDCESEWKAAGVWEFHGETFTPPTDGICKLQCVR